MKPTKRSAAGPQQDSASILRTRVIEVVPEGPHLWVELTQNEDRPHELDLVIAGPAIPGSGKTWNGGAVFCVRDPDALRALSDALGQLASEAEELGMLTALRASGKEAHDAD